MQELVTPNPQLTVPASGGSKVIADLPDTNLHVGTRVRVSVTITSAGAKVINALGLARFLHISLFHNGSPIIDCDGDMFLAWLEICNGRVEQYNEFGAGAGAQTATWDFFIPRTMMDLLDPLWTFDDLAIGTNNRIEFSFNGIEAITPTAAVTITAGTIDTEPETMERSPTMPLAQAFPMVKLEQTVFSDLPTAAYTTKKFNTGWYTRKLILAVEEAPSATGIVRSNTLVQTLERVISQAKKGEESFAGLRTANWRERPIDGLLTPRDGIVFWNWDKTRTMDKSRLLNLTGVLQAELGFRTAAAFPNGLRVRMLREVIVPGVAAAAAEVQRQANVKQVAVQPNRGVPQRRRRRR
jgi:hypothetical protein